MSDSNSPSRDGDSPNLKLQNLRRFRFQKRQPGGKMSTSEEDSSSNASNSCSNSNSSSNPPLRRKAVNRLGDTDSDSSYNPPTSPEEEVLKLTKEEKLAVMKKKYPTIGILKLHTVLNKNNWDIEEATAALLKPEEPAPPPPPKPVTFKRKNPETIKRKPKKAKKNDSEEDNDVDSDEISYGEAKIYDSDEDSDAEISNELSGAKKAVFDFLQDALPSELLMVSNNNSQKKADAIMAARPFTSWTDLVEKFRSAKHLDLEILNSVQSFLETRKTLSKILKKCMSISQTMEKAVAAGAANIKEQPKSLNPDFKLTPYQMVGLNWLAILHANNVNGILADEMGLGKTIQVIAFLTYLKDMGLCQDGPHLIVVPSSTMENWMNELQKWSPNLKVEQYYGLQPERREMRMYWRKGGLDDVDVILTTYNLISSTPEERKLFRVMPIQYVIFDEAHMLKNMSTLRYENLIRINSAHRLLLTGTPLQNNLVELMSLLLFIMPTIFGTIQNELKSLFAKTAKVSTNTCIAKPQFEQDQVMNAKEIMKPFVLRRLKEQVLCDLPVKTSEAINVPMYEKQEKMYKALVAQFSRQADDKEELNTSNVLMQLRKLANHPLLVRDYYTEDKLMTIAQRLAKVPGQKQKNPEYVFEDLLWKSDYQINQLTRIHKSLAGFALPQDMIPLSGKFEKFDELLPKLKEEGHRVLIFSQFTMILDIMEEYLTMRRHSFLRLDGQTPVTERQDLIDEYTENSSIFIFLLSTKAGGLGINLTSADTVIIHDIDFNPYNDKQAEDRCHRVGQKKPVTIMRLLSKDTIEEGMYEVAKEKLQLEQQVTGENEGTDKKSILKLLKKTLGLDPNSKLQIKDTEISNGTSENGFDDLIEEDLME